MERRKRGSRNNHRHVSKELIPLFILKRVLQKVKVWFQNRRTKHKRVQQDGEDGPEDQPPDGKKQRSSGGSSSGGGGGNGASSSSSGGGGGKSHHHQQLMMAGHSIGDEEDDDSDMSCDIELEDSDDPMDHQQHLPRHHPHHHHQATWSISRPNNVLHIQQEAKISQ